MNSVSIDSNDYDAETAQRINDLGHLTIMPEALNLLEQFNITIDKIIVPHVQGNYGMVTPDKAWANDIAMYNRTGVCRSVYGIDGKRIVVRTSWNQPLTEVMLEEEESQEDKNEFPDMDGN